MKLLQGLSFINVPNCRLIAILVYCGVLNVILLFSGRQPTFLLNTIQNHAQVFQYAILYLNLTHSACNMFRSVMDHLQGGTTSVIYKT